MKERIRIRYRIEYQPKKNPSSPYQSNHGFGEYDNLDEAKALFTNLCKRYFYDAWRLVEIEESIIDDYF